MNGTEMERDKLHNKSLILLFTFKKPYILSVYAACQLFEKR